MLTADATLLISSVVTASLVPMSVILLSTVYAPSHLQLLLLLVLLVLHLSMELVYLNFVQLLIQLVSVLLALPSSTK